MKPPAAVCLAAVLAAGATAAGAQKPDHPAAVRTPPPPVATAPAGAFPTPPSRDLLEALRFSRADRTADVGTLFGDGTQALTALVFVSARCPCSRDYEARVAALAREYPAVRFVRVYSEKGDPVDVARRQSLDFATTGPRSLSLFDLRTQLADLFGAEVTPEVVVLDRAAAVRYRGRIDDSQEEREVRRRDLRAALSALLAGKAPPVAATEPFGCTITRPGEPDVPGRMKGMKHSPESQQQQGHGAAKP